MSAIPLHSKGQQGTFTHIKRYYVGKQVNFYMDGNDERSFIEFLRADPNTVIFRSSEKTSEIEDLVDLPKPNELEWFALNLWHKHLSTPVLDYIERQGYYSPNKEVSEIIEFDRSTKDQGRLVRGRLWAEMQYWSKEDPPQVVRKSEAFVKWYNRLANWIKKQSERDQHGFYVMPGAAQFVADGGSLSTGVTTCAGPL